MGMFDDLIPTKQEGGDFADLIPKKKESSFLANAVGSVAEPLMQMASSMVAKPVSDVMGLSATAQDMANGTNDAAGFKQYIQDKLTYSPRTDAGKAVAESAYNPINIIGKVVGGVSGAAGDVVRGDSTNPVRQALGNAVEEAVPQGLSVGGAVWAKSIMDKRAAANNPAAISAKAATYTDDAIQKALNETGQSIADISPQQLQVMRDQVAAAFKVGKQVDPAALMRQADFKALKMEPTLGQITRDPMQFTREQNLRGIEGVGDPLMARFQSLGNQLQERVAAPATGAQNAYTAGNTLIDSMSALDKGLKGNVDAAYRLARGADGRFAALDIPTFSNLANNALDEGMLGHYVPAPIRSMLNDVSSGKIPFNVNTQVQFDSVLSKAQRSAGHGTPEALAISKIRDALSNTPLIEEGGNAQALFASAKGKALDRFKMQEAVPALKAAAEGSVSPDDFVRRFVVGGKTDEVKALSGLLKKTDPAAWSQARAQIGQTLQRAAFGENAAGDAPFAATRYMQEVRRLGVDKLGAFFTAQEVDDILRAGRVGTYIKQAPNASAVNSSNTGAAIANLASRVPGLSAPIQFGKMAVNSVQRSSRVKNALAAEVPYEALPQENLLLKLMAADASAGGGQIGADRRRY